MCFCSIEVRRTTGFGFDHQLVKKILELIHINLTTFFEGMGANRRKALQRKVLSEKKTAKAFLTDGEVVKVWVKAKCAFAVVRCAHFFFAEKVDVFRLTDTISF